MRRELWKLYKTIAIIYLKKRLLPAFKRDQSFVKDEYESFWDKWDKNQSNFISDPVLVLSFKDRKLTKINSEEIQSSNLKALAAELPKEGQVLELGSGIGINLFVLSLLCPTIERFEGVELTAKGVEIARRRLANPPYALLARMTSRSEADVRREFKPEKITFTQGSILELPYADNSFDAVFSHEVFEQMPYDYPKGFAEARRVTKARAVFVEGFKEADKTIFQWMHKRNVDYFRASVAVLKKAGFSKAQFKPLPILKAKLGEGIALAEK